VLQEVFKVVWSDIAIAAFTIRSFLWNHVANSFITFLIVCWFPTFFNCRNTKWQKTSMNCVTAISEFLPLVPFPYNHPWSMYLQSEKASGTFLDMWFSIFVSSMAAICKSILCDECFGWPWQNLSCVSEICDRAIFIVSTERATKFGSMIPNILCNKLHYFDTDQTCVDWTQKH
jgi:hypothetical protein